jgi:hypothetical protein
VKGLAGVTHSPGDDDAAHLIHLGSNRGSQSSPLTNPTPKRPRIVCSVLVNVNGGPVDINREVTAANSQEQRN